MHVSQFYHVFLIEVFWSRLLILPHLLLELVELPLFIQHVFVPFSLTFGKMSCY